MTEKINTNQAVNTMPIDATIEITVDPERKAAYLAVRGAKFGGKPVTPEQIDAAIRESAVTFGLEDVERIKKAVAAANGEGKFLIAKWKPPVNGKDGYIEYKFKTDKVAKPTERENGDVDFKNLGIVTNIVRGTKIARIYDPTEGEEGTDVLGGPVMQTPGAPAAFTLGAGTELSAGGHHILAAVDGNLVFKGGCFVVEENLVINGDVDLSVGNIDFVGNVSISGSVFEGFSVKSKKNITIRGAATYADIKAGGDVSIRLGCLMSKVECDGTFKADFCENSRINAKGEVHANSFVGCEVFARKAIIAEGKGIISGGKYTSLENILASIIGSNSYIKTEINIGNNAVLTAERENELAHIKKLEDGIRQLTMVIDQLSEKQKQGVKLTARHEQMKSDSVRTKLLAQKQLQKAKQRIESIESELALKQNFSVTCKKRFYPGTTIHIDAYTYIVTAIYENSKATVRDGEIVMVPA